MLSFTEILVSLLAVCYVGIDCVCGKQHYGMHNLNLKSARKAESEPGILTEPDTKESLSTPDHPFREALPEENRAHKASRVWRHIAATEESNEVPTANNYFSDNSVGPAVYSDPEWLHYIKSISEDMKSVKRQLSNIKYENHLLYRQMKQMRTKCGNEVQGKYPGKAPATGEQADGPPLPHSLPACPKGFLWHKDSNACYKLESDRITWHQARETCQSLGAELAAVETAREQRFLNNEAGKRADTRHCDFWTGGTDRHSEGKWYWVGHNKPMSYMNWNHNEPNNGGHNEHCMQMLWVFNWAWNDSNCKEKKACYICEINRKE